MTSAKPCSLFGSGSPMQTEEKAAVQFRIAVVVLNYRTPALVLDCLESLIPELDSETDTVVLVDNASGDGSVETIRSGIVEHDWRGIVIVESPHNGGFSYGNNLGVRSCRAEAYLLLNSDTLVVQGAIEKLWRRLESDSRIGLVGPRVEGSDGVAQVSCFRFPSPISEFVSAAATGPLERMMRRWVVPLGIVEETGEFPWISFCAVMVRREVFEQLGGMDDGFFMYFEDVDFCYRARDEGWKMIYEPSARIVHLCSGTSGIDGPVPDQKARPRYYYSSRARYFRRRSGPVGVVAANLMWSLGRSVSWMRETFGAKEPHTVEGELRDIWRM